ncbi:MAG: urease accessory protein UreD [Pseudomonadota bacterium]
MKAANTDAPIYQRSTGTIRLRFSDRGGLGGIGSVYQYGAGKVRFPRRPDGVAEALVLNTSGGLAGGDRFDLAVNVDAHTAMVSTQACERVYRALDAPAAVRQEAVVASGAHLIHMPQPTLVFDGAALHRTTRVAIAEGGRLSLCEAIVLGRAAMGETVQTVDLVDRTEVRLGGRLALVDAVRLQTDVLKASATPAILGPNRAYGLIVHRDDDLEGAQARLRAALRDRGGASIVNGLLVARLLAPSHQALQGVLVAAMTALTGQAPPRAWQL